MNWKVSLQPLSVCYLLFPSRTPPLFTHIQRFSLYSSSFPQYFQSFFFSLLHSGYFLLICLAVHCNFLFSCVSNLIILCEAFQNMVHKRFNSTLQYYNVSSYTFLNPFTFLLALVTILSYNPESLIILTEGFIIYFYFNIWFSQFIISFTS